MDREELILDREELILDREELRLDCGKHEMYILTHCNA